MCLYFFKNSLEKLVSITPMSKILIYINKMKLDFHAYNSPNNNLDNKFWKTLLEMLLGFVKPVTVSIEPDMAVASLLQRIGPLML